MDKVVNLICCGACNHRLCCYVQDLTCKLQNEKVLQTELVYFLTLPTFLPPTKIQSQESVNGTVFMEKPITLYRA
jgi:hypothetical protein